MLKKYGLEKPFKSWRKDKKLVVFVKDNSGKIRTIHFGQRDYSDFTQNKDKERRRRYLLRSAGIRDKYGRLTKDNKLSANYWARRILW